MGKKHNHDGPKQRRRSEKLKSKAHIKQTYSTPSKRSSERVSEAEVKDLIICGHFPVDAEIRYQSQRIKRLYLTKNAPLELWNLAKREEVPTQTVTKEEMSTMIPKGMIHQGALCFSEPFKPTELGDLLDKNLLLILDGVEDPRNLGRAVRSAHALNADGVIIPERNSAKPTAAAFKSAAGALSRMDLSIVTNLRNTLKTLKDNGFWIYGAAGEATDFVWQADFKGKVAVIIGSEGKGLRHLTRENCDQLLKIPMSETDISLNAADAACVFLYEVNRQRS